MSDPLYLSADEAAEALGIQRATLYAYVSRGLVRSQPSGPGRRRRRYDAEDVARLARRKAQRAQPEGPKAEALHYGAPVLDSAITLIDGQRCYYRGLDAGNLARTEPIEAVARLLWTGELHGGGAGDPFQADGIDIPGPIPEDAGLPLAERMIVALARACARDAAAWSAGPAEIPPVGARIMRLLAQVAGARSELLNPASQGSERGSFERTGIAEAMRQGWEIEDPDATGLIDAALVLSADQELNVSAFTLRCAISAGASCYAAVQAGLAALQGHRHGGHSARVAALLREVSKPERAREVVESRLRRGEGVPGFGHPLYPEGDPRWAALRTLMAEARPDHPELALADAVTRAMQALSGKQPNIDLGLVCLSRLLGAPKDAPLALFAVGRSAGWIAHAIEQVEDGRMIRPRARYIGRAPEPDPIPVPSLSSSPEARDGD